ncbi:unnamed protein product [Allacma fusca]|uniref:Uncharacterized protein n=1 Tax=Allacma fusca TaxID=39272 RepID=A0A8J2KFK9_9HEXA|nr:unnamed protein product [Allacma fusca]
MQYLAYLAECWVNHFLVAPELNLFGVSFQVAKKVCNELEPKVNYGMKIENWLSGLQGSKAYSSQEGKGIWKIGCSNKASSDGKSRKGENDCYDPCANVAPQNQSPLDKKENILDGKKECPNNGESLASLYYGNYYQCSNSRGGIILK